MPDGSCPDSPPAPRTAHGALLGTINWRHQTIASAAGPRIVPPVWFLKLMFTRSPRAFGFNPKLPIDARAELRDMTGKPQGHEKGGHDPFLWKRDRVPLFRLCPDFPCPRFPDRVPEIPPFTRKKIGSGDNDVYRQFRVLFRIILGRHGGTPLRNIAITRKEVPIYRTSQRMNEK